jgi:hypothetical protein
MPRLIDCHIHIMSLKTKWANKTFMHMPASLAYAETTVKLHKLPDRGFTTMRESGGADMGHRGRRWPRALSPVRGCSSGTGALARPAGTATSATEWISPALRPLRIFSPESPAASALPTASQR